MILLIDNYDSFSYNLYQLIGSINTNIKVIRNDDYSVEEIIAMNPKCIVISPGPGKPGEAGIIEELIQKTYNRFPILGICLGHQAIIESLGGQVTYANTIMHGKASMISIDQNAEIFKGLPPTIKVARYHSLVGTQLPESLHVIGSCEEIMAVKHQDYPVYGLQFHPESILTQHGKIMIQNFLGGIYHD